MSRLFAFGSAGAPTVSAANGHGIPAKMRLKDRKLRSF